MSPAVVVLASPLERDREFLRQFLDNKLVRVIEVATYRGVLEAIGGFGATLVLCDETFLWRKILEYLLDYRYPPLVVVVATSPTTDLYAEVLDCGGDYVLAKPFVASEVEWLLQLILSTASDTPLLRKPTTAEENPRTLRATAGRR